MNMIEALCEIITTLFLLIGVLAIWLGLYGVIVVENRPEILDRLWSYIFEFKDDDE